MEEGGGFFLLIELPPRPVVLLKLPGVVEI